MLLEVICTLLNPRPPCLQRMTLTRDIMWITIIITIGLWLWTPHVSTNHQLYTTKSLSLPAMPQYWTILKLKCKLWSLFKTSECAKCYSIAAFKKFSTSKICYPFPANQAVYQRRDNRCHTPQRQFLISTTSLNNRTEQAPCRTTLWDLTKKSSQLLTLNLESTIK